MIGINFGKWNSAYGRFFSIERLYHPGGKWTPFVKISLRYLRTMREASEFIKFGMETNQTNFLASRFLGQSFYGGTTASETTMTKVPPSPPIDLEYIHQQEEQTATSEYERRMNFARQEAAKAWCAPKTSEIVMNVILAEEFAKILVGHMYEPHLRCATTKQLLDEIWPRIDSK